MSDAVVSGTGSEETSPHKSLRDIESELNARASLLDSDVELGFMDTLRVIARTWAYVRFFKGRFAAKWILNLGALMYPVFVLPWGVKIVIDHVVIGRPITGTT